MVNWRNKKKWSKKSAILFNASYPHNINRCIINITYTEVHKLIKLYIDENRNGKNNYKKILDLYLDVDNEDEDFNKNLKDIITNGSGQMFQLVSHIWNDGKKDENNKYKTYSNYKNYNNYNSDDSD